MLSDHSPKNPINVCSFLSKGLFRVIIATYSNMFQEIPSFINATIVIKQTNVILVMDALFVIIVGIKYTIHTE